MKGTRNIITHVVALFPTIFIPILLISLPFLNQKWDEKEVPYRIPKQKTVQMETIITSDIPYFDLYGKYHYTIEDEKSFPAFRYRSFPKSVRRLMQKNDIESSECRGSSHGAAGLQACNRRGKLGGQIERLGWCWNCLEHVGYANHWMRCADDPAYDPKWASEDEEPYTQSDLRQTEADYRAYLAENPKVAAYYADPTPKEEAAMQRKAVTRDIDIFGRFKPAVDDLKNIPLSRFRAFPKEVRPLMQQAEIDDFWCSPARVERIQACNRSRRAMARIERLGWCWGSKDHVSSSAPHWMQCSQMPDRDPRDPKPDSLLYDEMDILRAERLESLPNPYRE